MSFANILPSQILVKILDLVVNKNYVAAFWHGAVEVFKAYEKT